MTAAWPQVRAIEQTPGSTPTVLARVASKSCTNICPTSRHTHSSNTAHRKSPQACGPTEKRAQDSLLNYHEATQGMRRQTLHHGSKLQKTTAYLLKKIVELKRMTGIAVVHNRHGVPFHPMPVEKFHAAHHIVERSAAIRCQAVAVVKFARAIDRQPHKPAVVFEKTAPLVGKHGAVGLYTIIDPHSSARISALDIEYTPIESLRAHQRFASMPCKHHRRHCLSLDILAYEFFKHGIAHELSRYAHSGPIGIKTGFFKIITIAAAEIAQAAGRFRHHIERPRKRCGRLTHSLWSALGSKGLTTVTVVPSGFTRIPPLASMLASISLRSASIFFRAFAG